MVPPAEIKSTPNLEALLERAKVHMREKDH